MQGCFGYEGWGGAISTCKSTRQPWLCWIVSPACPSGSYRADMDPPHCLKCPQHSTTESEGATICTCESGHYRAPGEGPQAACTRESSSRAWPSVRWCGTLAEPAWGWAFPRAYQILETDCPGCRVRHLKTFPCPLPPLEECRASVMLLFLSRNQISWQDLQTTSRIGVVRRNQGQKLRLLLMAPFSHRSSLSPSKPELLCFGDSTLPALGTLRRYGGAPGREIQCGVFSVSRSSAGWWALPALWRECALLPGSQRAHKACCARQRP